jgi:hypothetical protein
MNAITETGLESPLGEILNSTPLNWMITNHKWRSAYEYIDREMEKVEWSEKDPAYIPLMEHLVYCLLKAGLTLQADEAFEQKIRQIIQDRSFLSDLGRTLDSTLRSMFPVEDDKPEPEEYPKPEEIWVSRDHVLC